MVGDVFYYIALFVMGATAVALLVGLRSMMRGGSGNFSNKMMQLRVMLQAIAIAAIVAAVYFSRLAQGGGS